MYLRLATLLLTALAGAACTADSAGTPPPSTRGPALAMAPADGAVPAGQWRVVLVAGDNNSPAFDNGVRSLRQKLVAHGVRDIAAYSSDLGSAAPGQLATLANVTTALGNGGGNGGGQACLAFMTSHGETRGLFLRPARAFLDPAALDRALNAGCGALPTVVVISACHSGTFLTAAMRKPNRVILTAAAVDRTSFGCGAGDQFTYYDQCLLQNFDRAATWRDLALSTRGCVEELEQRMGVRQFSRPQTFVGAQVENLRLPTR